MSTGTTTGTLGAATVTLCGTVVAVVVVDVEVELEVEVEVDSVASEVEMAAEFGSGVGGVGETSIIGLTLVPLLKAAPLARLVFCWGRPANGLPSNGIKANTCRWHSAAGTIKQNATLSTTPSLDKAILNITSKCQIQMAIPPKVRQFIAAQAGVDY